MINLMGLNSHLTGSMWDSNNNLTEFDIESNGYYLAYAIVSIKFTFEML